MSDRTFRNEFPDFDPATMPAIPASYVDESWHNDTTPSFRNEELKLTVYVDYLDPERREFPDTVRFSMVREQEGGTDADRAHLVESDDWDAIRAVMIGEKFAAILKDWASEDEWKTMRLANRAQTDKGICHSHDFCDANMAMDEAFTEVVGRSVHPEDDESVHEADSALWGAAWDYAKEAHLTAQPDEE